MHTAMLLGAAKLLKKHEDEIQGTVKLMFQPAEEIFEGSQDMIENGLLKAPKVDAAFMIHVMAGMPFQAGTIIVSAAGVGAPAVDYFEFKVQGTG
ncbi:M20/M25/M40 family metallo-hydrolase [Parablautia muri]|uniref:M20/M25/M40 family metallo-hydrolase n=1 Tax=Parablautia muri TaxID=2320879 RepID=UPI0024128C36|nr:M20/M25/M40 family metallo-hydrolase [Parablautia muri]